MKTNSLVLVLAAFAAIVLSTTACTKAAKTPPPVMAAPSVAVPISSPSPALPPADPAANWASVHNYNYDRHAELLASLPGLEARVDQQIAELEARRAAMPATTDKQNWDFAMKEMADARIYLKSANAELTKAGVDTWDQQRDKVEQAWVRTQDAYRKVTASTTNG